MPVYNRQAELRRALNSLVAQSMGDFECVVVDDASTCPIEPIVAEYDDRFTYVRKTENGGCTAARFVGFERMRGEYLVGLDSDNELFPWALERATFYLARHREVGGVTGLYEFPAGLRVRVLGGSAVFTPVDYVAGNPAAQTWDCVGTYRRETVDEWLTARRRDYYDLDFALVVAHRLHHSQLFVDEPWGRYHLDGAHRITTTVDPRRWRDPVVFVEDYRPQIGTKPCVPVDRFLRRRWVLLKHAGRSTEADIVRAWMEERGSSPFLAVKETVSARVRTHVRARRGPSVTYLEPLGV